MTNELLEILPEHERAIGNKFYYEKQLAIDAAETAERMLRGDTGSPSLNDDFVANSKPYSNPLSYDTPERKLYEALCRNEVHPPPKDTAGLRCRYITNDVPFLKIAPFKIEEAFHDPYIVIFHDVMYDAEIDFVKQMAKPRVIFKISKFNVSHKV